MNLAISLNFNIKKITTMSNIKQDTVHNNAQNRFFQLLIPLTKTFLDEIKIKMLNQKSQIENYKNNIYKYNI